MDVVQILSQLGINVSTVALLLSSSVESRIRGSQRFDQKQFDETPMSPGMQDISPLLVPTPILTLGAVIEEGGARNCTPISVTRVLLIKVNVDDNQLA